MTDEMVRVVPIRQPGAVIYSGVYQHGHQFAVECSHPDCGRIVSVDVAAVLAQAAATRHAASHEPDAAA